VNLNLALRRGVPLLLQSALNIILLNTLDSCVKTQSACSFIFSVVHRVMPAAAQRILIIAGKTI